MARDLWGGEYTWDPDEWKEDRRPADNRCTPDKLLAFINELGKFPSLKECKQRFGGIIGPMLDGWELQRQGRWPAHLRRVRRGA